MKMFFLSSYTTRAAFPKDTTLPALTKYTLEKLNVCIIKLQNIDGVLAFHHPHCSRHLRLC